MFFRTTKKTAQTRQTQRTFRPVADQLESREVLSAMPTMVSTLARTFPLTSTNSGFNAFTTGLQTPGLPSIQNLVGNGNSGLAFSSATNSLNSGTASNLVNRAIATTQAATSPFSSRNTSATQGLGNGTRSLNGVNPNFLQNLVNQGTQTSFTGTNNPAVSNSSAVSNGLAFTNGLGFTNNTSRFNNNGASNGLAFTNGLGFSNPSFNNNGVSNGLAFTNGRGFSSPAGRSSGFNNAASTGLAFSNGQGGTLPARFSPFFNSTNTGLTFGNGLGFTNPSNNPFLRGNTSIASNTLPTNSGLGSGSITIGGPTGFSFNQPRR